MKAGGKIRQELFTDQQFLLDAQLLDDLARLKLSKSLRKIEKEGWAWVEIDPDLSWEKRNKFGRIYEGTIFTSEQQQQYDALQMEAEQLENDRRNSEADDKPERLETIEAAIEDMENAARGWKPEERALAGRNHHDRLQRKSRNRTGHGEARGQDAPQGPRKSAGSR